MEELVFQRVLLKMLPQLLTMSGMFLMAKFLFLHVTMGMVVYRNASQMERCALEIPPVIWGFMVLVSPIFGLLVFWLMHHSVLVRERKVASTELNGATGLVSGQSIFGPRKEPPGA